MHLIQMLRKESNRDCLADSLTKHSAKADELIKAVLTGNLMNVDAHPPFRTMLQNKTFLVEWLARNTKHGPDPTAFAGVGIAEQNPCLLIGELVHDPHVHDLSMHEFFHSSDFQFLNAVVSILHVTFLEPQEICVCIRSQFGLQPVRPMLFPIDNGMPLLASLFGSSKSKPSTPKPAGKRRASPLKDSPTHSDGDDESSASDYVMGEIKYEKKPKSDRQEEEDIPMEQADYDRDSDSDEDTKPSDPPLEERPRQKAMPMQPPVPTLRLTPKIKAQPSVTLTLPRRPTMKAPHL